MVITHLLGSHRRPRTLGVGVQCPYAHRARSGGISYKWIPTMHGEMQWVRPSCGRIPDSRRCFGEYREFRRTVRTMKRCEAEQGSRLPFKLFVAMPQEVAHGIEMPAPDGFDQRQADVRGRPPRAHPFGQSSSRRLPAKLIDHEINARSPPTQGAVEVVGRCGRYRQGASGVAERPPHHRHQDRPRIGTFKVPTT
jgi:hypothetical protein